MDKQNKVEISRGRIKQREGIDFGETFADELVKKFCVTSTQSVPLRVGVKLEEFDEDERAENWPFRELVGSLMWLSISTRPDIANAVRAVARAIHWKPALGILGVQRVRFYISERDFV